MMTVFLILFAVDFAVAAVYAKWSYPKVTLRAFFAKMTASAIFVGCGFYMYHLSDGGVYARLITFALVLGLIGDALLSLDPFFSEKNKKRNMIITTVIGAAFFFSGHIFYIVAFFKEIKLRDAFNLPVMVITWLVLVGVGFALKFSLKLKLGRLAVPMLIYTMCLCAMGSLSISLSLFGFKGEPGIQTLLVAAPLLFICSDASLGLKFADTERFGTAYMRYVTLLTYYPAQMLFALSVMLL